MVEALVFGVRNGEGISFFGRLVDMGECHDPAPAWSRVKPHPKMNLVHF